MKETIRKLHFEINDNIDVYQLDLETKVNLAIVSFTEKINIECQ